MTTATPSRPAPRAPLSPLGLRVDLALGALGTGAVASATCWLLRLPTRHLAETLVLYGLLAVLILRHLPAAPRGAGIGPANRVTLARAALVLPVAALAAYPKPLAALGHAWVAALAVAAMLLDGLDGRVARRTGTVSPFGARFDMELDAFLLLALSVLLARTGKVGAWVVLIGALRYLFVAAGLLWPALRGELPPSFRRKAVCVWQGVALLLALAPFTPAPLAAAAAATALAGLVYSFGVDVGWLVTRPRGAPAG